MDQQKLDLTPEEVTSIASFLGYGRPDAKVWFIGLEEGLGRSTDDEAQANLKSRSRYEAVMDLRAAHLSLKENQKPIDLETKAAFTQVWVFMAKIMLARNGHKDWSDTKDNRDFIRTKAKDYVRFNLGRRDGDTFLTELSPIPTRRTDDSDWMRKLKLLDGDLDQKIKNRRIKIRQLLKANCPSLIICYGKRAKDFAELIDIEWQPVTSQISTSVGKNCLMLPFFGNGQMSHAVIDDLLSQKLL